MKKLVITTLAAALSLPVALAATQGAQTTPAPAQTQGAKKSTKRHAKKRHHASKKPGEASPTTKK